MAVNDDLLKAEAKEGVALQTLQAHIEEMRSLTLCKICLRPLFEPFIIGCGHSFCYSCLRSWFGGSTDRKRHKNCPECRKVVTVEPAPNYLLREMTHMFISRAELLPEDETVAGHAKDRNEEVELMTKDKNEAGLFMGIFRRPQFTNFVPGPIHDFEDGVERCPICAWEVEDGRCSGCGMTLGDSDMSDDLDLSEMSESDHDDDESDSLSDSSDDSDVRNGRPLSVPRGRHFHAIDLEEDDEDEQDLDLNAYDQHDDFIDDEAEIDMYDMAPNYTEYPSEAATPYSASEADEFDDSARRRPIPGRRAGRVVIDSDEEDEAQAEEAEDDDDANDIVPRRNQRTRPVVFSDDEEDEDEETSTASQHPASALPARRPFHMPDLSEVDESDSAGSNSEEDEDDDGGSDEGSVSVSDPSDSEAGPSSPGDITDGVGEDSDDTVSAPQPKRSRQQRLQEHRDRRSNMSSSGAFSNHSAFATHHRMRQAAAAERTASVRNARRGRTTSVY